MATIWQRAGTCGLHSTHDPAHSGTPTASSSAGALVLDRERPVASIAPERISRARPHTRPEVAREVEEIRRRLGSAKVRHGAGLIDEAMTELAAIDLAARATEHVSTRPPSPWLRSDRKTTSRSPTSRGSARACSWRSVDAPTRRRASRRPSPGTRSTARASSIPRPTPGSAARSSCSPSSTAGEKPAPTRTGAHRQGSVCAPAPSRGTSPPAPAPLPRSPSRSRRRRSPTASRCHR
jgi:hypothetical protein